MYEILFELKKLKGIGLIVGGLFISVCVVAFMGYAGYVEKHISPEVVHITALSLFAKLIFPIFLSAIVIRNYLIETKEEGFLNFVLKGVSIKKTIFFKITALYLLGSIFFLIMLIIAGIFSWLKGQNPFEIYLMDYKLIVFFIMGIITVINMTFVIVLVSSNALFPGVIAVAATVFESFTNFLGIPYLNPWGYFESALYYRGLGLRNELLMILFTVFSIGLLIWIVKRKN